MRKERGNRYVSKTHKAKNLTGTHLAGQKKGS